MEKTLRVLGGEEGSGHSHSHSHSQSEAETVPAGSTSAVHASKSSDGLKSRKANGKAEETQEEEEHDDHASAAKQPSKLSAYLNLFGDFVHNMYVYSFSYANPC